MAAWKQRMKKGPLDKTPSRVLTDFQLSSTSRCFHIFPKHLSQLGPSVHSTRLWRTSHLETKTEFCVCFSVTYKTHELLGHAGVRPYVQFLRSAFYIRIPLNPCLSFLTKAPLGRNKAHIPAGVGIVDAWLIGLWYKHSMALPWRLLQHSAYSAQASF